MKYEFTVGKRVRLALIPENDMEKELLLTLHNQPNQITCISKHAPQGGMYTDGTLLINAEENKNM